MNKNIINIIMAGSMAASSLMAFVPQLAKAEASGGGIELSPVLTEITVKPGQSVTTTIRLRNVTKVPFVVSPHIDDFTAKGENGEPQILPDGQVASFYSLSKWVASPGDELLEPNVYKSVPVTINVPSNAEPGGHYGVVRFSEDQTKGTNGKTGVALTASVGTLLLVKVSGVIKESLAYQSFQAGSGNGPTKFFEHGPITFVEKVKNTGNIHEKPQGELIILASNGKKVATIPVNEKNGNVLPGTVRAFSESWKTKDIFGHYTATAHLSYASGQTLESPVLSFWIIPYHLIGYALLALLLIYVVLRLLGRNYSFRVSKTNKR